MNKKNIQNSCFLYKKLDTINKKIHRGKILQEAVSKTGLSIEFITKRAGYKRGTYYLHIKRKDLPLPVLQKYGKAISYDFSSEIPDMLGLNVAEPEIDYNIRPLTISEAVRQRDEWKEKYYALLEKYISLVEKQNKS